MSPRERAVAAVIDAWQVPGRRPDVHARAQAHLRDTWPSLARALERLVRADAAQDPLAAPPPDGLAVVYLNRAMVAAMLGVEPDTLGNYKLPPPDAVIGRVRGWRAATIAEWDAKRPRQPRAPRPGWQARALVGTSTPDEVEYLATRKRPKP